MGYELGDSGSVPVVDKSDIDVDQLLIKCLFEIVICKSAFPTA